MTTTTSNDDFQVEYSEDNKFPFYSTTGQFASICTDNHDDMYDMELVFDKVVERFPELSPEPFYAKVKVIRAKPSAKSLKMLKAATDELLRGIKTCLSDEEFVHSLHDRWGIGIDKLIGTLYAVYGYYFFTGKRTANIIRRIIDGYARKPIH